MVAYFNICKGTPFKNKNIDGNSSYFINITSLRKNAIGWILKDQKI